MTVKGGRLELLVPHMLRSQLLRPGFVRMSLQFGAARQMPDWAKLQFLNFGVSPEDLDRVLGRINGLTSWVDEWESLGREHEQGGRDALTLGQERRAGQRYLAASAAYNFAQYVMFIDIDRKRRLHESCERSYALAAPLFDVPATPFVVPFRKREILGYLRVPEGRGPKPVVVIFNGTNAVKEEVHWWGDALLDRGLAVITFDGPGLGSTFRRLTHVAEPRPIGTAILNHIETHPGLDPNAVALLGLSLGGYCAIHMASHDPRVRAVAAVSPPFSADVYWNMTLASMRRELAALYNMDVDEMGRHIDRITLRDALPELRCPLMVAGGGHDMITPGDEAWRIYENARCERELVFYPRGAHDCFNVLADLRPRMVLWLAKHLQKHRSTVLAGSSVANATSAESSWFASDAVDPDFADALRGEIPQLEWRRPQPPAIAARWRWFWKERAEIEVVQRFATS